MPRFPDPIKIVDAIGDSVMELPNLPARVGSSVSAAASSMTSKMSAAVRRSTEVPGDMPPDPVTFVTGAVDYVLSIPGGALDMASSAIKGVGDAFDSVQARLRRLVG